MSDKLVTVATFDMPAKARLAQNALEAAGIRAAVMDETVIAMDWLLSNAVGGVKLQVFEADADRAVEVLEQRFGPEGESLASMSDEPPPEPEAPESATDESAPVTALEPHDEADPQELAEAASEREREAKRAFLAAIFGWVVPVLLFYAFYLCLVTGFGHGPLTRLGWKRFGIAVAFTLSGLLVWALFVRWVPFEFFRIL